MATKTSLNLSRPLLQCCPEMLDAAPLQPNWWFKTSRVFTSFVLLLTAECVSLCVAPLSQLLLLVVVVLTSKRCPPTIDFFLNLLNTHSPSPFISILSNTRLVKSSADVSWFSFPLIARMAWRRRRRNKKRNKISLPKTWSGVWCHVMWSYLYDVEELVSVDAAVSIHVVKFEIPAQLVLHLSSHHQTQSCDVLHEVNVAVLQRPVRTNVLLSLLLLINQSDSSFRWGSPSSVWDEAWCQGGGLSAATVCVWAPATIFVSNRSLSLR